MALAVRMIGSAVRAWDSQSQDLGFGPHVVGAFCADPSNAHSFIRRVNTLGPLRYGQRKNAALIKIDLLIELYKQVNET